MSSILRLTLGVFVLCLNSGLWAQDKSATRGGLVKLPSAGGTVSSEQGELSLVRNRGSLNFGTPLPSLPVRAGFGPKVELQYAQTQGNEFGLGMGWRFSVSTISFSLENGSSIRGRNVKGDFPNWLVLDGKKLVHYKTEDCGDLYYKPESHDEDLTVIYRQKNLTQRNLNLTDAVDLEKGFEVIYPSGLRQYYSGDPNHIQAPAEGDVSSDGTDHVVTFPLAYEVDVTGETIGYRYVKFGGRVYLKTIDFSGGLSRYEFELLDSMQKTVSFQKGFAQSSAKLYSNVRAIYNGQVREQWCFAYHARTVAGQSIVLASPTCSEQAALNSAVKRPSNNLVEELRLVFRFGSDSKLTSSTLQQPTLTFRYSDWYTSSTSNFNLPFTYSAGSLGSLAQSMLDKMELVDFNNDSLVDVVTSGTLGGTAGTWILPGKGDLNQSFVDTNKIPWVLTDGSGAAFTPDFSAAGNAFHFADINGDGYVDVLHFVQPRVANIYLSTGNEFRFAVSYQFTTDDFISSDLFSGGKFQFLDLNLDGRTDIIGIRKTTANAEWWICRNRSKNVSGIFVPKFECRAQPFPYATTEESLLTSSNHRLLDMNGDRLPDYVQINGQQEICVYLNQGNLLGKSQNTFPFGVKVDKKPASYCDSGILINAQGLFSTNEFANLENLNFADINGDGVADLFGFVPAGSSLKVWLGRGDGGFLSTPEVLTLGTPITNTTSRIRFSDIDSDGQQELLIFNSQMVGVPLIIDFNRARVGTAEVQLVKPNLLTSVEWSSGKRIDLRYATSVDEMLRVDSSSTTKIHFPAPVVKQIAESYGTPTGTRSLVRVSEMLYSNPSYDPNGKDFVGYERVLTFAYGDDYTGNANPTQQSSVTREVFYTGASVPLERFLAGRTKERSVFAFSPGTSYSSRVQGTMSLDPNAFKDFSESTFARSQAVPDLSVIKPIQSTLDQWLVLSRDIPGSRIPIYFTRQGSSSELIYNGSTTPLTRATLYSQFDSYNYPQTVTVCEGGYAGVGVSKIPVIGRRTYTDYTEARSNLAELKILNKPSLQKIVRLTVGTSCPTTLSTLADEATLAEQMWSYLSSNGQVYTDQQTIFSTVPQQYIPGRITGAYSDSPDFVRIAYEYDSHGNPIRMARNDVVKEVVSYDSAGLFPIGYSNAMNHKAYFAYDEAGYLESFTDERGLVMDFTYDSLGRRTSWKTSSGSEQLYSYQVASQGKPQMILTKLRRYSSSASVPAGESDFVEKLDAYSAFGDKIASIEASEDPGVIRVLEYTEYNRNRKQVFRWTPFEVSGTLSSSFTTQALPTASGGRIGVATSYDAVDRVIKETYPSGLVQTYAYAPWGVTETRSYPEGATTVSTSQRIIRRDDLVYGIQDEMSFKANSTNVHLFERDALGRLSQIRLAGQTTSRFFFYDSLGRIQLQMIPEVGNIHSFYDFQGNLTLSVRFASDGDFSSAQERVFDPLGRVTEVSAYDGSGTMLGNKRLLEQFVYDEYIDSIPSTAYNNPVGLLVSASSYHPADSTLHNTTLCGYDQQGFMTSKAVSINGKTYVERYSYTLDSVLQSLTDPQGTISRYSLAPSMKIRSVRMTLPAWSGGVSQTVNVIQSVDYNPKGQLARIDYASGGAYTELSYDPSTLFLTKIISQATSVPSVQVGSNSVSPLQLQNLNLTYSGLGSVLSITDNLGSGSWGRSNRTASYGYNERNELVRSTRYGQTLSYLYDPAGQFTRNDDREVGVTVAAGNLLPDSSASLPYVFDRDGRLESGGNVQSTVYDSFGRLISVTNKQGVQTSYAYSHEGQRLAKKVLSAGVTTLSVYPTKNIAYEKSATESYVFVGDHRLARVEHQKKQWYYYIKDHIGSSDIVMNSENLPVEQMLYKPYGTELDPKVVAITGTEWANFVTAPALAAVLPLEPSYHRFTGQYLDSETGLYYYGARYYDPKLGRFTSPDELFIGKPEECVESPIECNLYSYARNNPQKYTDPTGMYVDDKGNTFAGPANPNPAAKEYVDHNAWKQSQGLDARLQGLAGINGYKASGAVGRDFAADVIVDTALTLGIGGAASLGKNLLARSPQEGLVHLTSSASAQSIQEAGKLVGNIYAGPAANAGKSTIGKVMATGLSPGQTTEAIAIPANASGAFSKVLPVGPFTLWQASAGHRYTANGALDLATGQFARQGANWNQLRIYGIDSAFTAATGAAAYFGCRRGE